MTRLAMTIDGARDLRQVNERAWETLGRDAGMSVRFARTPTAETVVEVAARAPEVLAAGGFDGTVAERIAKGTAERAAPWRCPATTITPADRRVMNTGGRFDGRSCA